MTLFPSKPVPFSLSITSRPSIPKGGFRSIPGQKCIFLVTFENLVKGSGEANPVTISTKAPGSTVIVSPQTITVGQIAEVIVVPDKTSIGKNLTITIQGKREGLVETDNITIEVIDGVDMLGPVAEYMRDKFVPWLAVNYPELDITNQTQWYGTIVNPRILVVMHYVFLSDDWEMYITWHVMIQPYDWAKTYLRHRFNEIQPSYAFEISSVTIQREPHLIEIPNWV